MQSDRKPMTEAERKAEAVRLAQEGLTTVAIASALGVHPTTIRRDLAPYLQAVPDLQRPVRSDGRLLGRRVTEEEVPEMIRMREAGESVQNIAERLGISRSSVTKHTKAFHQSRPGGASVRPPSDRIEKATVQIHALAQVITHTDMSVVPFAQQERLVRAVRELRRVALSATRNSNKEK